MDDVGECGSFHWQFSLIDAHLQLPFIHRRLIGLKLGSFGWSGVIVYEQLRLAQIEIDLC